jgi:hypothetical protein
MNTRTSRLVVAVTTVAICAGGTALGSPAQAEQLDTAGVSFHQFDDIGYVVAYRKEQMARDYVSYAADRARQAAAQPRA